MVVVLRLLFLPLMKAFFDLISVNTGEEGSFAVSREVRDFLLLSNSTGDLNR